MSHTEYNKSDEIFDDPTPGDTSPSRRSKMILAGLVSAAIILIIAMMYVFFFSGEQKSSAQQGYLPISDSNESLRVIGVSSDEGNLEFDFTALVNTERDELRGRTLSVSCQGDDATSRGMAVIPADKEASRFTVSLKPNLKVDSNQEGVVCQAKIKNVEGSDSDRIIQVLAEFTMRPLEL